MPASVPKNAPLELLLMRQSAAQGDAYANRNADYWALYSNCKDYLAGKYYSVAAAGLAREGGRFTRHDISHVDDVIVTAGQLLGIDEAEVAPVRLLNPYETFVLLFAILLHDAGNAFGRVGHERAVGGILSDLGSLLQLETLERRLIGSIAQAHGGRTERGERDTITGIVKQEVTRMGHISVRSRAIAAIVRLADELSENPRRADEIALRVPYNPEESAIHNLYCKVINGWIDWKSKSINLSFNLERATLADKFLDRSDGSDRRVYMVDYIARRLEKTDQERRYCNRFLTDLICFRRINVRIGIFEDDHEVEVLEVTMEDEGYPASSRSVRDIDPRIDGSTLAAKYAL